MTLDDDDLEVLRQMAQEYAQRAIIRLTELSFSSDQEVATIAKAELMDRFSLFRSRAMH